MVEESTHLRLLKDIARVEQQVPLGQFNGLGAGGRAAFFTEARDAMEVAGAVKAAIDVGLPYEIIGEGTSVLFHDEEYSGLVIHNTSDGFIVASDRSQVVVESGMNLQRFITLAASRGYGGMTQFFGMPGSIGGAVYHNVRADEVSILSSIRHLTVLMPPTKMKPFPTVVRQRVEWLQRENGETRLKALREARSFDQPRPVILNVQFQLTSVRPDEIQRRIQKEAQEKTQLPSGEWFGPLFLEPGGGHTLTDLLKYSGVHRVRVANVRPDWRFQNYLRAKRGAEALAIHECVEEMRALVLERSGIELQLAFEKLGAWEA